MTTKPVSKAAELRQTNRMLMALLKTPKTRAGLIAATATTLTGTISKNFIYGWLSEGKRNGTLTVLKTRNSLTYCVATKVVQEVAQEGVFPPWLDPRVLPMSCDRRAYLDGKRIVAPANNSDKKNKT